MAEQKCHKALVTLMDISGTMNGGTKPIDGSKWEVQRDSTMYGLGSDTVTDIISFQGPIAAKTMAFSGKTKDVHDWMLVEAPDSQDIVVSKIEAISWSTLETNVYRALYDANKAFDEEDLQSMCPEGKKIVDLSTDGTFTVTENMKKLVSQMRERGIRINAIGIGDDAYDSLLELLGNDPKISDVYNATVEDYQLILHDKLINELGYLDVPPDLPKNLAPVQRMVV